MKKLKILFGTVILSAGLASCSSAYYASAGYASDDLYAVHDRAEISRRKQAEAEAQRAAAEARRAEWEARIAEAKAAAAENSYYEYRSADANPYESVLADDYESAYARRLRGFESPTYKMPSSYINARYGSAFNYVSAYDPAFYNIVVMGDQVWVEPKYITSMFGSWGTVIYSDPWYYGWNRPWGPSFSFGSWGWSFGWNSWHNPWYGPGWGPWYSSWYDPWYGPGWGWGPGWHGHHHGPGWGPGWHGRPYHSNIVRRPNPYTSPSGTRYGVGSRSGSKSTGSMRGGSSGGRGGGLLLLRGRDQELHHFGNGERRGPRGGADESGHTGGVAHRAPGLVVQLHADQDVARQHLAVDVLLLAVLDLGDLFGRHLDLEDVVLETEVLHAGLEVGLHLVLVTGVRVHDVPVTGRAPQRRGHLGDRVGGLVGEFGRRAGGLVLFGVGVRVSGDLGLVGEALSVVLDVRGGLVDHHVIHREFLGCAVLRGAHWGTRFLGRHVILCAPG